MLLKKFQANSMFIIELPVRCGWRDFVDTRASGDYTLDARGDAFRIEPVNFLGGKDRFAEIFRNRMMAGRCRCRPVRRDIGSKWIGS